MNDDEETPPIEKSEPPTSFTTFKPVGHVVIGLPDEEAAGRAAQALADGGIDAAAIVRYRAPEMEQQMARMLADSSGSAEFGHEIVVMRKLHELAAEGCAWLVVPAPETEDEQRVAAIVEPLGARLAVKYGRLFVTELISPPT